CDSVLPERPLSYSSSKTGDGYSLQVPGGAYLVRFVPDDTENLPEIQVDGGSLCGIELDENQVFDVDYPSVLTTISGRLRASAQVATGVADATVFAEVLDGNGRTVESTRIQSDSNGDFTLFFPPMEIDEVTLVVGPGDNALVPVARIEGLRPNGSGVLPTQVLDLDGTVRLTSNLLGVDETGANTEPVLNARVLYRGEVGPGTYSVAVDALQGSQVSETVPPGSYEILVIPTQNQPFALSAVPIQVPSGESSITVDVILGRRVPVSGVVTNDFGAPVANARVSFFSRESPISREFRGVTDENGRYALLVDPSIRDGESAEYEVSVEPTLESGEPLLRELIRVPA
ncbi:MAG: carboxypeptidase-like regulatory domain-containing protein, partial [Myxococcota bacterium]